MPYVPPADAPNLPKLDLEAIRKEMGAPPWRKPLVGTHVTRWMLIAWPPGFTSVPHTHPHADEVCYILEGEGIWRLASDGVERRAGPGSLVWSPKNVQHVIGVPGPETLLMLVSVSPNQDVPDETVEDPTAPRVRL